MPPIARPAAGLAVALLTVGAVLLTYAANRGGWDAVGWAMLAMVLIASGLCLGAAAVFFAGVGWGRLPRVMVITGIVGGTLLLLWILAFVVSGPDAPPWLYITQATMVIVVVGGMTQARNALHGASTATTRR